MWRALFLWIALALAFGTQAPAQSFPAYSDVYIDDFAGLLTEAEKTEIRARLVDLYDKTGIVELATGLHELGWDLVSSGGTATSSSTRPGTTSAGGGGAAFAPSAGRFCIGPTTSPASYGGSDICQATLTARGKFGS